MGLKKKSIFFIMIIFAFLILCTGSVSAANDTIAPTVTTVDPANGATNVPGNKVINVTFSEPMQVGNSYVELKDSNSNIVPITQSLGSRVLTITPNDNLNHGQYTLYLHTGCYKDMANNNLALYSSTFTVESTAPTVSSVDPADGSANIPGDKQIKVTFSEPMQVGTGYYEIKDSNSNVIPATSSLGSRVLTITPTNYLDHGQYTLYLHTGSYTDLASNSLQYYTSDFTIESVVPTVTANLSSGTYNRVQTVSLTATDNLDAHPTIYYTLNGDTPTTSSTIYTSPIKLVNYNNTLSFIAKDDAGNYAQVQTRNYILNLPIVNLNTDQVYSTIQDAINDASNLDSIQVNEGNYYENIVINKQIDLASDGNVTIHALNPSNPVITINSNGMNSSIQGFNLVGATNSYGIYLNSSSNNTLTENNILNNLYGIYNYNSNNNKISGNIITGNLQDGIDLNNSSAKINFNRIVGNTKHGLEYQGNGTIDATNNWWGSNNGPTTSTNTSDIYLTNGKIHYNPWLVLSLSSSGIVVTHDNYTSSITGSLTYNSLNVDTSSLDYVFDGIIMNFNTTEGYINSTIVTNDGAAIATLNSNLSSGWANVSVTLDNQTISMIQKVFGSIQTAIDDNSTLNDDIVCVEDGLYTENINLNKTLTLMAKNSKNSTIQPLNPSQSLITIGSYGNNSSIKGFNLNGVVGSYAIYLNSANNCTIDENNISSSNCGIYFYNSLNNKILENILSNNLYDIYIYNSNYTTISNNTISNSTLNGIDLNNSLNNTISENTITGNLQNGIDLNNSLNNTISENTITGNLQDGIDLNNSSAKINFNRIVGNTRHGLEYQGNGTIDATNNWWGSNNGPTTSINSPSDIYGLNGTLNCNTWLILKLNKSIDHANNDGNGYNYIITADICHNNQGNDTYPNGNIPDAIPIYFNTSMGNIDSVISTKNGKSITKLNNTSSGIANISATLDNQTTTISINIGTNTAGIHNNRTGEGFTSIQSAIDDINTLNGDTITLTDGTYTENVMVDANVTIRPLTGANVTIQAADPDSPVFTITSDGSGSTIEGLSIIFGTYGIELDSANNCNIFGNFIKDSDYGISLEDSNNNNITQNNITTGITGIFIDNSDNNNITGNNIDNRIMGVYISSSNNNHVYGNNIATTSAGINILNSNNTSISENNIDNTGYGITNQNSSSTISRNDITNNTLQDILQINSNGIVMSTTVYNCGPAALATIMQKFGLNVTDTELSILAGTDDNGTCIYGLIKAAEEEGLIAKGLKLPIGELEPGNIVLLTQDGKGHFCIVTSITDSIVYLADPDLGNINMTLENFTAEYSGNALVVTNDSSDPQLNNNNILSDDEMQSLIGSYYIYWTTYTKGHTWKYRWVHMPRTTLHTNLYYPKKIIVHHKGHWNRGVFIGNYFVVYEGHTITVGAHEDKRPREIYFPVPHYHSKWISDPVSYGPSYVYNAVYYNQSGIVIQSSYNYVGKAAALDGLVIMGIVSGGLGSAIAGNAAGVIGAGFAIGPAVEKWYEDKNKNNKKDS